MELADQPDRGLVRKPSHRPDQAAKHAYLLRVHAEVIVTSSTGLEAILAPRW